MSHAYLRDADAQARRFAFYYSPQRARQRAFLLRNSRIPFAGPRILAKGGRKVFAIAQAARWVLVAHKQTRGRARSDCESRNGIRPSDEIDGACKPVIADRSRRRGDVLEMKRP